MSNAQVYSTPLLSQLLEVSEIVLFLHPPKSGGTSVVDAFRHSPSWIVALSRDLTGQPATVCESCGQVCDRFEADQAGFRRLVEAGDLDAKVFITFGHGNLHDVCEFLVAFFRVARDTGTPFSALPRIRLVMTYRPQEARLSSYFRHYWDRALPLVEPSTAVFPMHDNLTREPLARDSQHYRDLEGAIMPGAWFAAFEKFRAGPRTRFTNHEIFRLRSLLFLYSQGIFPEVWRTEDLDLHIQRFAPSAVTRKNVSRRFPEVDNALAAIATKIRWSVVVDSLKHPGSALAVGTLLMQERLSRVTRLSRNLRR